MDPQDVFQSSWNFVHLLLGKWITTISKFMFLHKMLILLFMCVACSRTFMYIAMPKSNIVTLHYSLAIYYEINMTKLYIIESCVGSYTLYGLECLFFSFIIVKLICVNFTWNLYQPPLVEILNRPLIKSLFLLDHLKIKKNYT